MVSQALPAARSGGFTLPELMAVVAIMATLAAVAGPSFTDLIASQRAKSATTDLFGALLRARSEAVKRNATVTLQPNGSSWQSGWTIPNPTTADAMIDVHGAVTGTTISGPASVVFQANGRLVGASRPSFDIQAANGSAKRCIEIDLSGRPIQKKSACPTLTP